jgi:hypothetical protein
MSKHQTAYNPVLTRSYLQPQEPKLYSGVLSDSDLPAGAREYGVKRRAAMIASCRTLPRIQDSSEIAWH